MNNRDKFYEITKKYDQRHEEILAKSQNAHGVTMTSEIGWIIAEEYIQEIKDELGGLKLITEWLKKDEIVILNATGSSKWILSGEINDEMWRREPRTAVDSFKYFLRNVIMFYEDDCSIDIKISENTINLDLSNEAGILFFEELYKHLSKEVKSNTKDAEILKVELVKLKEQIELLNNENSKIKKELFQNDIQSIIDSLISIGGPISGVIMALYNTAKTGKKYITAKREIKIEE